MVWMGALLLAVVLTWPAAVQPGSGVLGSPDADGMKHLWTLWWIRESVLTWHQLPFHTELINFPVGLDLYPIEPLNGLAACLLGFLPLGTASNVLVFINLTLTGVAGCWMGRTLSGSRWGGVAAGILLEASSFSLFTVHVGVGELQHLWWLPLGLGLWSLLRRRLQLRTALTLAAVLIGATLSCFYYGFFLATGLVVLSLTTIWAGDKTPRLLGRYALAAGLAAAVVLPVTKAFSTSYGPGDVPEVGFANYVLDGSHGQPVTDPDSARLDLPELVRHARSERQTASREKLAYGGGRYLGWPALVLVLAGLALRPRRALPWLAMAGVGILLAMGSYLLWGGEQYSSPTTLRVAMPFLFLNRALGYLLEPINFPIRFLSLTTCSVAAIAALAAGCEFRGRSLGPWVALLALLNAVDVQFNQLIPHPLPRFLIPQFDGLTLATTGKAVADMYLVWRADPETRSATQAAQMIHRQPIQGVPIERVEYYAQEGQIYLRTLPMTDVLHPAFKYQQAVEIDPVKHREDLALLREAGFDRVLLLGTGPNADVPSRLVDAMSEILGEPIVDTTSAVVFQVPDPQATEEEIGEWIRMHDARIEAFYGQLPGQINRALR